MKMPQVSVICPVYNEEKYIDRCMQSILRQDYPKDRLEVIFIDGMSTDATRRIIKEYTQQYGHILLLENQQKVVPYALNKGINAAQGDVIIRIDGHCEYPPHYISTLVRYLYELNADNVGGVWDTLPANNSDICHAIAIASSHPFGVGGSMHKIGASEIIETDTVPFGCYRKEVFEKLGDFDTDLIRNQDDEFNARLIKNGGKIFLIPEVVIKYTARDSFAKMRKMYYQYGLFKPLVNKKLGSPATIRQFFPLLFLLGIVLGGILSYFSHWVFYIYIAVLLFYLMMGISVGLSYAIKKRKPMLMLLMPYAFLNTHLSYGLGYLVGLLNLVTHRSFEAKSNR